MFDISIIIPIYNGEKWIDECMRSIGKQSILQTQLKLEIITYDDGSTDSTYENLLSWSKAFADLGIHFCIIRSPVTKGVGAAKNMAIKNSTGTFLCFQDIDDIMFPNRIYSQWKVASYNHNALVGSKIIRYPYNSTPRLVKWANNLSPLQLKNQVFTANGSTILMPTWFCHRQVFDKVKGFDESGPGTPEDLIFFYRHLDSGGDVLRVDEVLLTYTYHKSAVTFSIHRQCIWQLQLKRIETHILSNWNKFTVWNAGKAGKKFVRALSPMNRQKVAAFCDIDKNKIGKTIELYCPIKRNAIACIPVISFDEAKPPFVICMKLDLTGGKFENNLKSLNITESIDYILFS